MMMIISALSEGDANMAENRITPCRDSAPVYDSSSQ